jgi:hypothetical protein
MSAGFLLLEEDIIPSMQRVKCYLRHPKNPTGCGRGSLLATRRADNILATVEYASRLCENTTGGKIIFKSIENAPRGDWSRFDGKHHQRSEGISMSKRKSQAKESPQGLTRIRRAKKQKPPATPAASLPSSCFYSNMLRRRRVGPHDPHVFDIFGLTLAHSSDDCSQSQVAVRGIRAHL